MHDATRFDLMYPKLEDAGIERSSKVEQRTPRAIPSLLVIEKVLLPSLGHHQNLYNSHIFAPLGPIPSDPLDLSYMIQYIVGIAHVSSSLVMPVSVCTSIIACLLDVYNMVCSFTCPACETRRFD